MRVKRGNVARNRRKKVLKLAKGFRASTSKLFRPARQAVLNALRHSYKDRRLKKREFRSLWIARTSAAVLANGLTYSVFMGQLKKNNVEINRKMLSEIAISNPDVFTKIVAFVK